MSQTPDRHPGPLFLEPADALPDGEGEVVYYAGGVKICDSVGIYDPRHEEHLTQAQILVRVSLRV